MCFSGPKLPPEDPELVKSREEAKRKAAEEEAKKKAREENMAYARKQNLYGTNALFNSETGSGGRGFFS